MRILLAFDKFKGSMSAEEAGAAAAKGLQAGLGRRASGCEIVRTAIADGGEGTVAALHGALGGEWKAVSVADPVGRPSEARYTLLPDGTAAMEMSAASGFELVADLAKPQPRVANTFGTGQMISHAARAGAERILIGIGGSATNDGGAGMARALGFRFLDRMGEEQHVFPWALSEVDKIEAPSPTPHLPPITVACDVTNPLLGSSGAIRSYGPQKGVQEEDFGEFEERLERLAELALRDLGGSDFRMTPGAGAAGGLGWGLLSFCRAELRPGFELVADAIGLAEMIARADLVITGEGRIDRQTLCGKGPHGVALMAKAAGVPCIGIAGALESGLDAADADMAKIIAITPEEMPLKKALAEAPQLMTAALENRAEEIRDLTAS